MAISDVTKSITKEVAANSINIDLDAGTVTVYCRKEKSLTRKFNLYELKGDPMTMDEVLEFSKKFLKTSEFGIDIVKIKEHYKIYWESKEPPAMIEEPKEE